MEGLNNKDLSLTVLEAGESKIEVPADWLPGEGSLPCLQAAAFSLHALMAHPYALMERESSSLGLPLSGC